MEEFKKNKEAASRRSFLKISAIAATAFMIVPRHVLGGKGFLAPSNRLIVAGVGDKSESDIAISKSNFNKNDMKNQATILEKSLLVLWNERNSDRRLEIMNEIYTKDIVFYESHEGDAIVGHDEINKIITGLQSQWPLTFTFELNRPSATNHQIQHISWNLGNPGEKPVASGMDVAIMEGNKIKSLHLMLDTAQ